MLIIRMRRPYQIYRSPKPPPVCKQAPLLVCCSGLLSSTSSFASQLSASVSLPVSLSSLSSDLCHQPRNQHHNTGLNHFIIVMGRSLEKLDLGQIYNHHLDLRHDPSIDLGQSDLQTPHELCQDDMRYTHTKWWSVKNITQICSKLMHTLLQRV